MIVIKTAVSKLTKFKKPITDQLYSTISKSSSKMANWESEKQKYLAMDLNTKRQNYKDYKTLKDIPTWREYVEMRGANILPKIDLLPGLIIDSSHNKCLADKISYYTGDITKLEIDAIVNAANKTLRGGGGVDGAIHRAAGGKLKDECITLGGCETGEAKITGGYKLPAKYVIHTVGPVGEKPDLLKSCYKNSLQILVDNDLKSIAFPCISTGVYGYPQLSAAHVAAYAVRKELEKNADKIDRVIFCLFMPEDKQIYETLLQSYFPLQ